MNYTKNYDFGPMTFKTYFKAVGNGYEVGVTWHGHTYFVGNFIHKKEAVMWWKKLGTEMKYFVNKYDYVQNTSNEWYCHFLSNHMYKVYYKYLDTLFTKYNKTYEKAVAKDTRKYKVIQKKFHTDYNWKKSA